MMQKQFEMILACAPGDHLLAMALREWLELAGVRVLMATLPLQAGAGPQTLAQLRTEGQLALVLTGNNWQGTTMEVVLQPLVDRARSEWQPFLYHTALSEGLQPPAMAPDLPVHWLPWEGSFRSLAESLVQELVGKGWQRPPRNPRKGTGAPNPPRGGNQTIKGNRNIQIGGDLHTGSGFTLNT